jgi:hypothetical protein
MIKMDFQQSTVGTNKAIQKKNTNVQINKQQNKLSNKAENEQIYCIYI